MSRKKKRQRKPVARRRSANAVHERPRTDGSPLQRMLDIADGQADPHQALEQFQTALDACQYIAAVSVFDNAEGRLWDIPEARYYLRAAVGVATSLWRLNRSEEAVGQFREVLQADPVDHLLARYWLAACLLADGQFVELKPLLDRYDEPTAFWRYAQALGTFATDGDCDESRLLLGEARRLDARFVDYILGDGLVRADQPIRFEPGRNDTHSTARLLLPAWRSVSGAVSWLRRTLRVPLGQAGSQLPFPREQLLDLPQQKAVWQVGLRELDRDQPDDEPCWVLCVANLDARQMRCLTVIEGDPTPDAVWRELLTAFLQPTESEPQRPRRLEVPRPEYHLAWSRLLDQLDVQCRVAHNPEPMNELLEGMANLMAAQRLPGLAEDFDPCDLPLGDATWQIDFFHQPMTISNDDIGVERPWSVVVMDKASSFVLCSDIISGEPTAERLWEYVARVMLQVSGRPRRIEMSDSDGYDFLRPRLAAAEVDCVLLDELPELHAFCLQMASSLGGPEKCALADGQDVDYDGMESFYYAADRYFRQAPWKHVPGEIPIEIAVAGCGTRYAIVLGRTGVTLGLALHESWRDAADMISGRTSWDEISGSVVIFDEETVLAPADLYLLERHGWPIAAPEAYPAVMRFEPGYEPASPTADNLKFLVTCLDCLPDFVRGDAESKTYSPSDNGPQRETRLSWASSSPRNPVRRQQPEATSTRVIAPEVIQHVNRKLDTYYLHQGRTKTGKPKYFFSKKADGELLQQVPDGFEIYESPRGQVYCRRIQPKLITEQEIEVVREAIRNCGKQFCAVVDVKGRDIIIHESDHPCLQFSLCDDDKRLFEVSRWCFLGSIDDWFPLLSDPKPLSQLARNYCRHLGEESFFELM